MLNISLRIMNKRIILNGIRFKNQTLIWVLNKKSGEMIKVNHDNQGLNYFNKQNLN